jgi:hypothetical protein
MQHGDLDKTKVLKTKRDSMSDVRKPNSNSVLKSVVPVRPVLNTGHVQLLTQICQFREFPLESALSLAGVTLLV